MDPDGATQRRQPVVFDAQASKQPAIEPSFGKVDGELRQALQWIGAVCGEIGGGESSVVKAVPEAEILAHTDIGSGVALCRPPVEDRGRVGVLDLAGDDVRGEARGVKAIRGHRGVNAIVEAAAELLRLTPRAAAAPAAVRG